MSSESGTDNINDLHWYHPNTTRHVAETLLLNNGEEGSYLLRDKRDGAPGRYVLSIRSKDAVNHYEVKYEANEYHFGFGSWATVAEFEAHFETQPLVAGENGVLTVLRHPYPRNVEEPETYATVRIHANVGNNRSMKPRPGLAVGSKEGYLTKRGGNIKNWKTRWFTLERNYLKYFKERSEKSPIRSLDLRECTECATDTTFEKDNCFRLVFPRRTFYMFAATAEELNEWLTVIKWKLDEQNKLKNETI